MINKADIKEFVLAFRSKIEPLWSEASAFQGSDIEKHGPYIPDDQCAVTCMILMTLLREAFPELRVQLVGGQMQSTEGSVRIRDHVWLRLVDHDSSIIVDPTGDQSGSTVHHILVGTTDDIAALGIQYIEREVEEDLGEERHPNRFKRYCVLRDAWDNAAA